MFWAWKGFPGIRSLTKNRVWDSGNVNGLQDLTTTRVAGFPKHWLWEGDWESRYSEWRWQTFRTRDSRQKGARMWNQGTGFPTLCVLFISLCSTRYSFLHCALLQWIVLQCSFLHRIQLHWTVLTLLHCVVLHCILLHCVLLYWIALDRCR